MEIREARPADIPDIIGLYHDAGWTNYTNHPDMLTAALQQSLKLLTVWEGAELIGIIRAVGDAASILYIQDLIVRHDYRRRGIGTKLLRAMDSLYPNVYQKVLLTDDKPDTAAFYQSCGFADCRKYSCAAMIKMNK